MRAQLPTERLEGLAPGRGLASAEVEPRRGRFGRNDIVERVAEPWRELARETARDPMLWFLVGTGAVYAALGETAEAVVLGLSILPIAGMDLFLHQRTQASTQGLKSALATRATVVRDGREVEIAGDEVVAGDLAIVRAGEPFPADGVLEEVERVLVDESSLTGESDPVEKRALARWPSGASDTVVDDLSWGFAGTRILSGRARLRVVQVGASTIYGSIVRSAQTGSHERTPLQVSVSGLVKALVVAAVVLCAVLALVRWRQGHGALDALLSAMTLAIAALPEEFPVVFSVFLGVGVHRLAKKKALVRRAVSVENVGRVTVLCSDKTGTITRGALELTHVIPAAGSTRERVLEVASAAAQRGAGDPLDEALLALSTATEPRTIERFPFTETRRRETAIVEHGSALLAATKGSPEIVLAACALDERARARVLAEVDELAAGAHKVIAVASRAFALGAYPGGEPDRGFTFEGLLAFEDPVRPGVREAVRDCRRAALRLIVVTGDHPATALAIAKEIGITSEARGDGAGEPRVVLGEALERELAQDGSRTRMLAEVAVVARAVPAQKLLLVRALQRQGELVAVTGDGVNDVPALQAADVGIAMGGRGTRSAREIASIVLLDDDFTTIVGAIAEGRQLLRNLKKSFQYLLVIHVPLVLTAAAIPLAGYPLLYLPIHVIWLELVIHPTALLVFQDAPPARHMEPLERAKPGSLFGRREWAATLAAGAVLALGVWLAFDAVLGGMLGGVLGPILGGEGTIEHARALVLAALTLGSIAATAALGGLASRIGRTVALGTVLSSALLIQIPSLASRLHLIPLHAADWGVAGIVAGVAVLPLLLLRRLVRRT